KLIELMEEKAEFEKAGQANLSYVERYGSQDKALYERSLYDAATDFERAELYAKALETEQSFLKTFPKSPRRKSNLWRLADTKRGLGKWDLAARYFEKFAKDHAEDKDAGNGLRLAGLYYWANGQTGKAEKLMIDGAHRFPGTAAQIESDLIEMY